MTQILQRFGRQPVRNAVLGCLILALEVPGADGVAELRDQVHELREQNRSLQEQLQRQQSLIQSLDGKIADLEKKVPGPAKGPAAESEPEGPPTSKPFAFGNVIVTGEGGVGLFHQGSAGAFSKTDFRLDEAKLFLEAKVWDDIYFYTELNLASREDSTEGVRLGEVFVDFEDVSKWLGLERLLNLRAGRFDIPFGEEYLHRDVFDNPLISHSLADLWGVDEGIELYGSLNRFQYALAVQNGGHPALRDYNSDKSVAGRLGYDPARWLHLSVSGMRTGDLDVQGDRMSELWFGNGFIRALGPPATTTTFHSELIEGDVQVRWPRGHLKAAGGYLRFDDNDSAADQRRDVYYYYVEGLQGLVGKLYAAGRVSQIFADGGFPIVAGGRFGDRFYGNLTKEMWRLSLGLGYRLNRHLVLKGEYTFDRGRELGGRKRDQEDMFSVEAGFRF